MEILKEPHLFGNKTYKYGPDVINANTYKQISNSRRHEIVVEEDGKWLWFAIKRNPLERFISSFVDKCINEVSNKRFGYEICYGCNSDVRCFVDVQLMRARLFMKNPIYIEETYEDRHFMPQSWFCNFEKYKNRIKIFKFEDKEGLLKNLNEITIKRGFKKDFVENLISDLFMAKTAHSTLNSEIRKKIKRQILNDKKLLRKIYNLYYIDYKTFGYRSPEPLIKQ
uniref:T5orf172 domain-containing protein n=1 Tax=Parastrongyloides trichosuri TaxID=131310 RepID=A0A0N4Z216_PARTI